MHQLSVYILTYNSERRIAQVLDAASQVADEIIVVDSGSTDRTESILTNYSVRLLFRKFDNFRDQRVFAEDSCKNNWVLALDSDEVLSDELVSEINTLKNQNFTPAGKATPVDGFCIKRDWFFLGKRVRNFYPVQAPDYVVRLFRKDRVSTRGSRIIHESARGPNRVLGETKSTIKHFSCDSIEDLYKKVDLYTSLMAEDMFSNGEKANWLKLNIFPWVIWAKWYFLHGSWKDGEIGLVLSKYIRITVYLRYLKLMYR